MTARRRLKQKGRREGGQFVLIPHVVIDSENWRRCSATAIKLLTGLARQFNGRNNGDLAPSLVTGRPAHQAMARALRELVHYRLLLQTKHGGLGMPSLYALTWLAIDDCRGKLEVPATATPSGAWKEPTPPFKDASRKKSSGCESAKQGLIRSPLRVVGA